MRFVLLVVGAAATLWLLIQARDVFQPMIIAFIIWFMLKAAARAYTRAIHGPGRTPTMLAKAMSAATFAIVIFLLGVMVTDNAIAVEAALPTYEANLNRMIANIAHAFGRDDAVGVSEMLSRINLSDAALGVAGSVAGLVGSLIIIMFYVIFIFVEEGVAAQKLTMLIPDQDQRTKVADLLLHINREIEVYLGVKLILGLVQAIPTFLILTFVGVDGAVFWAIVIFFFSFIPTIGTMVGIIFPALMTLVQFETIGPFLIVAGTLAAVQLLASNGLEPRLMGKSLNLSPLGIFIAIFVGSALWGIVGALIVVPVLAVVVIVSARVPVMHPVAIILSSDGQIEQHQG